MVSVDRANAPMAPAAFCAVANTVFVTPVIRILGPNTNMEYIHQDMFNDLTIGSLRVWWM